MPSHRFERRGLPTRLPLASKLWRCSQILHKSPFDEDVLRHTEAQLDFILEMYAADHPDEFKFTRGSDPQPLTRAEMLAAWEGRLLGQEHERFLMPKMPSEAVLRQAASLAGSVAALRRALETGSGNGNGSGNDNGKKRR